MAAEQNLYAKIPTDLKTTAAAAEFVESIAFNAIPPEAIRIGTRCLLDGLGLFVAGSEEHTVQLLAEDADQMGGRTDALAALSMSRIPVSTRLWSTPHSR